MRSTQPPDFLAKQRQIAQDDRRDKYLRWTIAIIGTIAVAWILYQVYSLDQENIRINNKSSTLQMELDISNQERASLVKKNNELKRELAACKGKDKAVFTPNDVSIRQGWGSAQ